MHHAAVQGVAHAVDDEGIDNETRIRRHIRNRTSPFFDVIDGDAPRALCTGTAPDAARHHGPAFGLGPSFCWTRVKFLETSSSLRPSNFREISGKSVNTGDRQGTAPPLL